MSAFRTLRTLVLAAAVISPLAAGAAHAEQEMVPPGSVASPAWTGNGSRTMLAGQAGNPQQNFLSASGATGGDGQHG